MDSDALIYSLISRLGSKLSSLRKSGNLSSFENDPLVTQTYHSLIDLSKFKLQATVSNLLLLLDKTMKGAVDESSSQDNLMSQLFILKLIDACLDMHWRYCRDPNAAVPTSRSSTLSFDETINEYRKEDDEISIRSSRATNETAPTLSHRNSFINDSKANEALRNAEDPPPLDDTLASNLMKTAFQFLHISYTGDIVEGFLSLSVNSNGTSISKSEKSPLKGFGKNALDTRSQIQYTAGQILKYISASNWPIIFQRLRYKIVNLTAGNDEGIDLGDFRYVEWCNLNEKRLAKILQELNVAFLQFKRPAQLNVAIIIRKAIWTWIELYPKSFFALHQSSRRLEGGPEILFDMCNALADNARRRAVFWPLQVMLLLLCPDILGTIVRGTSSGNKKTQFLESLRKTLKSGRLADVAAVCYVDLYKASTYLSDIPDSALRDIITDIESELKEKLFDPRQPFMNADGIIDQKLMTDCLTAFFRLDSRETTQKLIQTCLQDQIPFTFPLVLVKSCYNIVSRKSSQYDPTVSCIYASLAGPLRLLFHKNVIIDRSESKGLSNIIDKKTRKLYQHHIDVINEKVEILLNVLKVFCENPKLAIIGHNPDSQRRENSRLLLNLTICLHDPNLTIVDLAAQSLIELHNPELIALWGDSNNMMETFWTCSSPIITDLSNHLINFKDKDDSVALYLVVLLQILTHRVNFIRAHPDSYHQGMNTPERLSSLISLETALLVMLCMPSPEICSAATQALGVICDEMELTKEHADADTLKLGLIENLKVYKMMPNAGALVTGRVAQQKSVRKILRLVTVPRAGNLNAWEEIYKRWRSSRAVSKSSDEVVIEPVEVPKKKPNFFNQSRNVSQPSIACPSTASPLESKRDHELWSNYTAFLCSLGGVCGLIEEKVPEGSEPEEIARASFTFDLKNKTKKLNSTQLVNRYGMEMVELLLSEVALIRETVKEIASTELNPLLYEDLLHHFDIIANRFFTNTGVRINTPYTIFVEHSLFILKTIIDRLSDNTESLFSVSLDMGNLLHSFARYLNFCPHTIMTLRVKIRFCQLTESLMIKRGVIDLRQEFLFRNKLLEYLVEWSTDFMKQSDMVQFEDSNDKIYRDLDVAVMKAVVLVLEGLPLQPAETKSETERQDAKSKLFYRYFSYFIKLLNRCRVLESIEQGPRSTKENSDLNSLLVKSKESLKDLGPLKDYTILALSNLLSGNIECGLKYSLSMGYHEDLKTRSAFMQVLTNILKQGTEFEILGESTDKDRFQKVITLLCEPDLAIAMSLCDVCPVQDVDELGTILLNLFDSCNLALPVLKAVIEKEINKTDSSPELFRRNSIATRLLASFVKMYGSGYMRKVLQPVLDEMINNPRVYEVDPSKISSPDQADINLANLKTMCHAFLDAISNSGSLIPPSVREICSYLSSIVVQKFPEANTTSVGGLIFLRFFCPAIVAPDNHGLVKVITDKDLRRGLLLITKVIQNLANNVFFGSKEAFMRSLNDVLTDYIPKVKSFLIEISTPLNPAPEPEANKVKVIDEDESNKLHFYLVENIEKIGKDIATRKVHTAYPLSDPVTLPTDCEKRRADAKLSYYKLSILLAQLGTPNSKVRKKDGFALINTTKTGEQAYRDFMAKYKGKSTAVIQEKQIFYEGGLSKERRPVFYFIARRFYPDEHDLELLIYYIFKVLEKQVSKSYELFFDMTQFGNVNEAPVSFSNHLFNLFPYEAQQSISAIYFLNVTTSFQNYTKVLGRKLPFKFLKRTQFLCNMEEVTEYIHISDIRLPKLTMNLDAEITNEFPVTYINRQKQQLPAIIKISKFTIQVNITKKQEILGLSSYFNDVYHISQIDDISINSYHDESCLVLKCDNGAITLIFKSPKIDIICKTIRTIKTRHSEMKPAKISERIIRPKNVPGTLLNMALLNSGSDDPNLRLASYNLLFALSATFKFDVGNQLMYAKDMCIPSNNTNFVIAISERIADTEPQLTYEFLTECFVGMKNSTIQSKHLCLEYMAPWISNIKHLSRNASSDSDDVNSRTRELLALMIDLTVKELEMAPSIQSKIWRTVGQVDELIDIVLETIVQYAVEYGIGSQQSDLLADTIVTLSSVNVKAGKLVSRLRKIITKTSYSPKRQLSEHIAWAEICILVRFNLMLSFNNRFVAQHYLPEIFHCVSVLAASGPSIIRSSIHGLIVNVIQSLCTCLSTDHPNFKTLAALLTEFSEPKFKLLFGLNRNATNPFSNVIESESDLMESIPLPSLETIVHTLLDILTYGSSSIDQSNAWRARWMSLITTTAFQFNPAVQPRAFIVLGCLARGEVDDALLYQILMNLKGALELFDATDCNLIVSIIMCLTNITENLPEDSKYLQPMFWLSIAVIQIGHLPLISSAVNLLEIVTRRMNAFGMFLSESIGQVLLSARTPFLDISKKLDNIFGVNFEVDFSFAFSAVLAKGLKDSSTKNSTLSVLQVMLSISNRTSSRTSQSEFNYPILGYLAPQLPIAAKDGDLRELLASVGIEDSSILEFNDPNAYKEEQTYYKFLDKISISNPTVSTLLVAMMSGLLEYAEFEPEYLYLYGFFAEAALTNPEAFTMVQARLVPKMNQVLLSNQTAQTIEAVQSILYTVLSNPFYKKPGQDISIALDPLGFKGLLDCPAIRNLSKDQLISNACLVAELVGNVIGLF